MGGGEEHGRTGRTYCRSVLRGSQNLQVLVSRGGRRRFLWTQQVDAAAGVGEEEETRGGDSNRARAEEQWREEEEGWQRSLSGRPIYKASS